MSSPRRELKLALLVCDEFTPPLKALYDDYTPLFAQLLSASLARVNPEVTFSLDGYDVYKAMAYPPDDVDYDGLLISGSRFSAYDDVVWIDRLVAYVKRIIAERPSMKVFGICFGHQIVARALGGTCVPNDGRWEIAVTTITLTPLGKAIFGASELDLQQMHRDHVPLSPPVPNAHLLGATDLTPNHGMVLFDPARAPTPEVLASDAPDVPLTSIQVLTVQGHPEFTEAFMATLVEARTKLLGEALAQDAQSRAGGAPGRRHLHPDGLACDGVGRVGRAIWGVLGVV